MGGTADDDASQSPPPRPSPPSRERESIVIQAKANEEYAFGAKTAARSSARELFAAGAIGGAVGMALALAGVWLWAPQADVAPLNARVTKLEGRSEPADASGARLSALESDAHAAASERRALAAQLAAGQAAFSAAGVKLAERIATLESVSASAEAERKAAADAARDLNASIGALQRDVAAERNATAAERQSLADEGARLARAADAAQSLEQRFSALEGAVVRPEALAPVAADARAALDAAAKAIAEAGAPKDDARWASLAAELAKFAQQNAAQTAAVAALQARLDKIEAATPAPLSQAPSEAANGSDARAAERAVAAMALLRRFDAGEPVGAELAALERLGAAPAALAPFKAYAQAGAPSKPALARAFEALAPQMLAAGRPTPAAPGDVARTFLAEVQGLVKIRRVGDSRQADVEGVMSRVADAVAAGDLARALGAVGELPPAAQATARDWSESVAARLAADRAAEAFFGRAVADLGAGR